MKAFLFDCIIEKHNICGMKHELQAIETLIESKKNVVLYGRRNVGKTSLIKSVVMPNFKKRHKQSLAIFIDLMGVRSLDDIYAKIIFGFEQAFRKHYPIKTVLNSMASSLKQLSPQVSYDPLNHSSSISFNLNVAHQDSIDKVMAYIQAHSKKHDVLLVFDEFQDIVHIPSAQELLRSYFQGFNNLAIIVMGSMKHLLSDMFSKPQAPLANFGYDVTIQDIEFETYRRYMNERFKQKGLFISKPAATYLQELMHRIPEAINMLCFEIQHVYQNQTIEKEQVIEALNQLLYKRQSRFKFFIKQLSDAKRTILVAVSRQGLVLQPAAKDFIAQTKLSARSLLLNVKSLYDEGVLEKSDDGYSLADPLLDYFIKRSSFVR